ncbi:hypothetical protein ACMBCN_00315 [Candidatus Liberibacter asiaticus]|nr:hypothetical protein [Candidatus Liberibacter asiaticus]
MVIIRKSNATSSSSSSSRNGTHDTHRFNKIQYFDLKYSHGGSLFSMGITLFL